METTRCTVWVYLRKSRPSKDGKAPLLMRLSVNGKRWDSALKARINPNDWDPIKEKATGDDSYSNLVNETIESAKFRIHKIKLGIEDEGKLLTLDAVKNKFLDKDKNQCTILALFQKHNVEDYPRTANVNTLLPVPSNQKMNTYLKEIGDITKINKVLTTHTARRTFATTIMLQNGVSMEAVSKMLGHISLFMTRKYAKVDEYYIAQETEKVRILFKNDN